MRVVASSQTAAAGGRRWPWPEPGGEPFGWVGTQEVGGAVDGDVDGSPVAVGVTGLDAVSGERVRPALFGRLDGGPRAGRACAVRVGAEFDGVGVVDDDEIGPGERPDGVPSVGTLSKWTCTSPAVSSMSRTWPTLSRSMARTRRPTSRWVRASTAVVEVGAQCGRVGDVRGVPRRGGRGGLAAAARVRRVVPTSSATSCASGSSTVTRFLAAETLSRARSSASGSGSASVGSGMPSWWRSSSSAAWATGGVEPGAVAGTGEGDVGAFAVEAGGADDEHVVAGDALGLVDRDGVGVVDPAVVEVAAVEDDVVAAGDAHGHVLGDSAVIGAAHAVVDGERLTVGEVLGRVVSAHHDSVADA